MKVGIDDYRNEFIGEILKFCVDGNYLLFYDEISGGLYRVDKNTYIVEVIITPMELHQKEVFPVSQILKWKNEIYLIPNNISHEWLIYDIKGRKLRSVELLSQAYEIDRAVNVGKWIYLIPEKTNHILAIVEVETLNIKMITTNWYKNNSSELECWGYSSLEDIIIFPIIGAREIFLIQGEEIIELSLHIKQTIYSISLSTNGIWVLPNEGNDILFVDKKGKLIDSVEILINNHENGAEQFARIIAVEGYVYLFPKQGGQILVLEIDGKKWTAIGETEACPFRPLFRKTRGASTYWGCYDDEEKLYTLPLTYRFAEINIKNELINYKVLRYATSLLEKQYMSWVYWLNEKTNFYFAEKGKNSLKNYFKIALGFGIITSKEYIGENIWGIVGNRKKSNAMKNECK